MGYKMKPGSGSSAKNTGRGLAERGLVPDRKPKATLKKLQSTGFNVAESVMGALPTQRLIKKDKGPKMHKGVAHDSESLKNAAREGLLANTPQATSLGFDNSNFDPKSGSYSPKPVKVETFDNEKFLEDGNKPYKMKDPKARKAFEKDSTSFAKRNKSESIQLNSLMDKNNKVFEK